MRTIWKYPVPLRPERLCQNMPAGAELLHVEAQQGAPCLWVLVDDEDQQRERRCFAWVGTGHPVAEGAVYVGTVQMPPYVWHLFEEVVA